MFLPLDCPPLHTGVLLPEFFDKTFLPVHMTPTREEGTIPLSYLVDRFAGLIKMPFLIWEAERIQEILQRKNLGQTWLPTVSISSNTLEFVCWLGERGYLEIALPTLSFLRKVYYLAKIILYSYAVLIDSELLHGAQLKRKEEEGSYAYLLLMSHMTYLSCMSLGCASLTFGAPCSRRLLRLLHSSSLLFDIASKSYEWKWGDTKKVRIDALKSRNSKQNFTYE